MKKIALASLILIIGTGEVASDQIQKEIFRYLRSTRQPASIEEKPQKDLTDLPNSFDQLAKTLESSEPEKKEDLSLIVEMVEKLRKDIDSQN